MAAPQTPGSISGRNFPIQELRNIALRSATTPWVIYVESDMFFGPNAANVLMEETEVLSMLNGGSDKVASLIPLYQTAKPIQFPLPSKENLRTSGFVPYDADSHSYMDFEHWESQTDLEITMLSHTHETCCSFSAGKPKCSIESILRWWCFEPYYLAKKSEVPMFDPILEFQTWDKLEQIKLMAATGHAHTNLTLNLAFLSLSK